MAMKSHGRSKVSEFIGNKIVYRNLAPLDPRLPPLDAIRDQIGLSPGVIPRKSEGDYARVVAHLLRQARFLDAPRRQIERLVFVGDTRLNDGTAFDNLCQAGGWPGLAFIGSETGEPLAVEMAPMPAGGTLYLANRWEALGDFDRYCQGQGFPVDEGTAVVFDLDKTTLGARGRNDHVIDGCRVQAVQDTVSSLLEGDFDPAAFQTAYNKLNQVEFHPFTSDNQDYLAYICLILGGGLFDLERVLEDVRSGRLSSFSQFIERVNDQRANLPASLASIHDEIYEYVRVGDPTPFKAFRRNEYIATVDRMGNLEDGLPADALVADEIVLTQEVRQLALGWLGRGALLFALSDKPDEASIPTPELAAQGYLPIHCVETHVVGDG